MIMRLRPLWSGDPCLFGLREARMAMQAPRLADSVELVDGQSSISSSTSFGWMLGAVPCNVEINYVVLSGQSAVHSRKSS